MAAENLEAFVNNDDKEEDAINNNNNNSNKIINENTKENENENEKEKKLNVEETRKEELEHMIAEAEAEAAEAKKKEMENIKLLDPRTANDITFQLLRYITFLTIFTIVAFYSSSTEYPFWITNDLNTYLLQNTGFTSLTTSDDFWNWLQVGFLPALLAPQFFSGKFPQDEHVYILGSNRLLGAIRLRQLRVMPNKDCTSMKRFVEDQFCYPPYAVSVESKENLTNINSFDSVFGNAGVYHSSAELQSASFWAALADYDGGGYVQILNNNLTLDLDIVANLQVNNWIDAATRVVLIEMSVYNVNLNIFSVITIATEFLPSGGVVTSYQFLTQLFPIYDKYTNGQVAFEVILLFIIVGYIGNGFYSLYQRGAKNYFSSRWDYVDILNYSIFIFDIIFRIVQVYEIMHLPYHLNPKNDQFLPIYHVAVMINADNYVIGFNLFLCYFKVFKYLKLSHSFSQLILVLEIRAKEILYFFCIFAIVFVGYAVSGLEVWGTNVYGWRTFTQGITSLFRGLIEAWLDYPDLYATNRIFAGIFYASFYLLVYFVLFNIFIAIIWAAYDDVRQMPKKIEIDVHSLFYYWRQRIRNVFYNHRPRSSNFFDTLFGVREPAAIANRIARKYMELEHHHAKTNKKNPHSAHLGVEHYAISLSILANDIAMEAEVNDFIAESLAKGIFDDFERSYNQTLTSREIEDWSYRLDKEGLHLLRYGATHGINDNGWKTDDGRLAMKVLKDPLSSIPKSDVENNGDVDNKKSNRKIDENDDDVLDSMHKLDSKDSGKIASNIDIFTGRGKPFLLQIIKELQELRLQNQILRDKLM